MSPRLMALTKALAASVSLATLAGVAIAESDASVRDELRALREEVKELRAQLQSVKQQSGAQFTETLRRQDEQVKVKIDNARPTIETPDGSFTASIRARVQLDGAYYDQDTAGPVGSDPRRGSYGNNADSATEAARARDLGNGFNFRRAQIGVEGTFFKDFGYSIAYQFGGSGTEEAGRIQDVYLEYKGIKGWKFRLGAFTPPTNLDDAQGSGDTIFLERASSAEISRGLAGSEGRVGAGILGSGDRWTASLVYTANTIGVTSFEEQSAIIGRFTGLAFDDPQFQLHLGANATYVYNIADAGPDVAVRHPIRLRDRPELRVDGTRLIDTGNMDAKSVFAPGVEIAARYKALLVQAEHFWYQIERNDSPLPDPDFSGYYVQASYTLTGEPRRYNTQNGAFTNPRAAKFIGGSSKDDTSGLGAWEVAARYSVVDLDYRAGNSGAAAPTGGVRGGRQEIWTAGLNWYLNNVTRLSLDYQHVDVDRLSPGGTAFGPDDLTPAAGTQVGQTYNVVSFRSQISF